MKKMINIFSILFIGGFLGSSCEDEQNVPVEKDWNTTTFFQSVDEKQQTTYYKPYNGYVGDPMPFYDPVEKIFKVLYLQDYRPNPVTFHPIWCVETVDAANYTSLGELIPTGSVFEQDAAIGTGSTIYNESDKLYYTFYTGHSVRPDVTGLGEGIMFATSSDFKTWDKNQLFLLRGKDYGYSNSDFRDPFVFKGDDGLYHMLVSTKKGNKGVLAEFVSKDLNSWECIGDFMNMMWDRFYECPDLFKMGDWWYLIYSEKHAALRKVQYFKGRTLEELKSTTANDAGIWPDNHEGFLDSRGFYAGKTASDGTNRYIWGWCPTRPGNDNVNVGAYPNEPEWAGNLVVHRVIQHEDGTLTLGEVKGISDKYNKETKIKIVGGSDESSLSGGSYTLFNRLEEHSKISFVITTRGNYDKFGVSFVRGSDSEKYYSIIVNPENENNRKINFVEEGQSGKGFVDGIDGYVFQRPLDNVYHITIYTDNSTCVVYINDVCCYTNRIYGIQKNCWSINCYEGDIVVDDLKVFVD